MKPGTVTLFLILAACLLAAPANAFTAEILIVQIQEDGGADVTFTYSLSFLERVAVFFQIADPTQEFKQALEGYSGQPVVVEEVSGSTAVFSMERFASVREEEGILVYTTPALRFTDAEEVLSGYWFAPLIQLDFSPSITVLEYPDGSRERWEDQAYIPSTTWRMHPIFPCGCRLSPSS